MIFEAKMEQSMAELGGLIMHLCVDACVGLYEARNGRETRVHQVKR